ncbi:Zinc finger CCCH domain-containing protein [Vigna angularis]|uniref:Zinc finger CCCH domain-containing protein n=1 Tax=Phaseolus angularis TaxID=3914 RepID=A0A8T0KC56_PHAAN|nr:Zinc finger CCCH domain-containing protein [Vigna angularis]
MEDGKSMGRKEKRKAMKKMKRKQTRKEAAESERREEEDRLNDPEEQRRMQLLEQEEAERMQRDTILFQEREKAFMDMIITRQRQQQQQERDQEQSIDHDNEFEYVVQEEGPPEIIWQGNEIIFNKKQLRVRVPDTDTHNNFSQQNDDIRPTSNPLPPESESESRTQNLQDVAEQIPNFGTEQDKAHCPFHLKTGACRFGRRCSRVHFIPDKSSTLLMENMYNGPGLACDRDQDEGLEYTDEEIDRCFEEFYEDVHTEFLKFGEIVNFKVCKNGSFHLRGNVYVQYKALDSALLAANLINRHDFTGKRVTCQFVNLTRWKVAICGEYMKSGFKTCSRGTACNFIHCFRNPGGDYEWADSDKPPPKFWVEKMIALFGYSDDYETSREQGNFSLSKTDSDRFRYHCRRSRSRETDRLSCGHSGRRKHEDERKQRTPYEDRNASLKNTHKRKSRGTTDTDSDREWLEKEEIRERRHEYTRNGSFNKRRDENSRSHEEDSDMDCDTRDNEKQHGRNPRKCDNDIRVWINEAAGLDGDRDVRKHRIRESSGHQSGDASESNKDLFGRVEMETLHDHFRKTYSHRRSGVQVSVKGRDQNDKVDRDGSRKDSYKRDHHKRK